MPQEAIQEILEIALDKELSEAGGGHNQKGVDYQRYWSIYRMFQLEEAGEKDFLFVFETIQDVAVFDSEVNPAVVCVYQIKKRERKEWSWGDLTALDAPPKAKAKIPAERKAKATRSKEKKPADIIKGSPIGKIYATVSRLEILKGTGRFISNAGCDLPLSGDRNAATSLPVDLSQLSEPHLGLLTKGLLVYHKENNRDPDLSLISVEKAKLYIDDTEVHLKGIVYQFLLERYPSHANQAGSLIETLFSQISALNRQTDSFNSFEELKAQRGYAYSRFSRSLNDLQTIPDRSLLLDLCMNELQAGGMNFFEVASIKTSAASMIRRKIERVEVDSNSDLLEISKQVIDELSGKATLRGMFEHAYSLLHARFPSERKDYLQASFAIALVDQWPQQT